MNSNDRELSIEELTKVSGGGIKGAVEGVCRKDEVTPGQSDPAQMFQQILNQLSGR
ncbi:hypothetical protein KUL72_03525 [Bradyrhizobium arachidis]|uniref:hypothetical protein n=1 Tax=Bradyrhizobium TaxID=374 RepID=UPI002161571A|nr:MULTISPECIES: hypothetical protein [Bradyrhizobium]MDN4987255.1 hypothetical protein [Bradyrhizobium sp. WYCCWR 13022]UVO37479.1 hypothetical protein KUL72_03525 [Bradyrhizobium arachidis]